MDSDQLLAITETGDSSEETTVEPVTPNMESILTSIKAMLGIEADYTQFDNELVIFINSAINKLLQIGVGPDEGFKITGAVEVWTDLLEGLNNIELAKEYVYFDVRRVFDPPSNAFVMEAFKEHQEEAAWRLSVAYDINHPQKKEVKENGDL